MVIAAIVLVRRVLIGAWILVLVGLISLAVFTRLNTTFIIRGGSMEPAIPLGSLVSLDFPPANAIRAGDVVTITAENGVVITHRVVRAVELPEGRLFEVKGDANSAPDPTLVPARAVVGRVAVHLPVAGYLVAMLASVAGVISLLALLASGLLTIWLIEEFEAELIDERIRRERRAQEVRGAAAGGRSRHGAIA
ncbi:MAG TPA: signal peptidase I [Candidatus Limnocylindria bacterium]